MMLPSGAMLPDGKLSKKKFSGVTDCRAITFIDFGKLSGGSRKMVTFRVTDVTHSTVENDPDANVEASDTREIL